MNTAQDQQSRADFEAHHAARFAQPLTRWGDTYANAHVRCRWEGWQAARALPAGEPVAWLHINRLGASQTFTSEPPPGFKTQCTPLYTAAQVQAMGRVPPGCAPNHAEIYVGDGRFALCDWEDWEKVKGYKWRLSTKGRSGNFYAQAWSTDCAETRVRLAMHRLVLGAEDEQIVDHINGDGLDNRKRNLRFATFTQNSVNAKKAQGTSSQYKGVCLEKETGLWRSYVTVEGRRRYLGRFQVEQDAAVAYNTAAKEAYGEYAKLNSFN